MSKNGASYITIRPYYIKVTKVKKQRNHEKVKNTKIDKNAKVTKMQKSENHQNAKSDKMKMSKKCQSVKKGQKRGGMSLKGVNVTLRVFRAIWWGHFCQTAWTPVFCIFGLRTGF